ncbi:MAG: hypothetical protein LBH75_03550 [Treponema sp.]|jgi:hypothetical protein|nr:hypothetical protein [Treponema sp.]
MRKLIALTTVGVIAVTAVFAQVGVSGYGTSYFIPYRATVPEEGDTKNTAAVQAPWGEPNMSAGVSFNGWSEFAGFSVGFDIAYGMLNAAGGSSSVKAGYTINGWLRPHERLKFNIGNNYEDIQKLMGKVGSSNFSYYVLDTAKPRMQEGGADSANNIFTQFNPAPWGADGNKPTDGLINNINLYSPAVTAAFMTVWQPIDGMWIGAMVTPEIDLNGEVLGNELHTYSDQDGDFHNAFEVYKNAQVAISYNFPGIGLARVQYIGYRNIVEAAFQVLALGDLMMDIGVKIPFTTGPLRASYELEERDFAIWRDYQVAVGATYRYYEFGFSGHIDAAFGGYYRNVEGTYTNGLDMVVYLTPTYEFPFAKMGLDLGFEYMQKPTVTGDMVVPASVSQDGMQAGVGLWLERKFGNGTLRGGLVSRFPLEWTDGTKLPFELFVPLRIEVGF